MTWQAFMTIATAVSVVTGVGGLLAPAQLASVFGVALDDVGLSQARLLGAAYIGYGVITWFGRETRDNAALRAITLGNLVGWSLGLIVGVVAIVSGLGTAQTWLLFALQVAFAAAWGYFAVAERHEVAPT